MSQATTSTGVGSSGQPHAASIADAKADGKSRPARSGIGPAWTIEDAAELYQIRGWGKGFFDISPEGHVVVRPNRDPARQIDLHEVVAGVRERGFGTPVLIHFGDLLKQRLQDLHDAFAVAIRDNGYRGEYCAVYPIKVNQQRRIVEEIRHYGEPLGFGLEVGSKPELLAVLGLTGDRPDRLIVCNGFKEERYIEFTALAAKLRRTIIPVIENLAELRMILESSERLSVRPRIGVRVNLSTSGVGRWRHSSGVKAKFGLSLPEVIEVVELLKARGMADCLQLLHCHMGSQIHDIAK